MCVVARRAIAKVLGIALAVSFAHLGIFLLQIHGIRHLAAGEHAQRLLGKGIHTGQLAAVIDIAPELVKPSQQRTPRAETVLGHVVEGQVILAMVSGLKRAMACTKEARLAAGAIRRMPCLRGQANEWRDAGLGGALQFGNRRADARPSAGRLAVGVKGGSLAAAVAHERIVRAVRRADNRADAGPFIHDARHVWQQLADLDAGHVGGNGVQVAAIFLGRIGLEINEILVRRRPGHVDHDYRLVIAPHARGLLGGEQLRQGETAEHPHAQEIPPAPAITLGSVSLSTYLKHVLFFCGGGRRAIYPSAAPVVLGCNLVISVP